MGVGPPPDDERSEKRPPAHPDLLRTRGRVTVGLVFFALYALTFGLRGHVASGLVGGALGGFLVFLLLREAEHRRRRRS